MSRFVLVGLAFALTGTSLPAFAKENSDEPTNVVMMEPERRHDEKLLEGLKLVNGGKPTEAIKLFDPIIADYEARYGSSPPYRCANGETAKATIAFTAKNLHPAKFVLGSDEWCTALFGKGFALIDLGKPEEAGPYLARAVEMDPLNAHFINEYAEWFKPQRQWQQSYDLFLRAWRTVDHDKRGPSRRVAARSLRGMAYNMIELGDLSEAERLYRQSLEFEPEAAAKVQGELDYIADARAKQKAS